MYGNSRRPHGQSGVHPQLRQRVRRHLAHPWRAPIADHTRAAFEQAQTWRERQGAERSVILDSACGTGVSSVALAEANPVALVIALDQSRRRLERAARRLARPPNLLLLRAECADFWRLAARAGWRLDRHYLLYPNPWPRPAHLGRRWHGHPAFPALLELGGELEVRSNWLVYLEEFVIALDEAGGAARGPDLLQEVADLSDFEAKYRASGHALYRIRANLGEGVGCL